MKAMRGMLRRSFIGIAAVGFIAACGESDSPGPQDTDHPQNVGSGWISIQSPQQRPSATDRNTIRLSGSAFVSRNHQRCCSGSATDTAVTVSWSNSAGGGGGASQAAKYCSFFGFGPLFICEHTWSATASVVMGTNVIVVRAQDPDGNIGYNSIRVVRTPDTTPPRVFSTSPSNEAAKVSTNSAVTVYFSEPIDPDSITPDAVTVADIAGNPVPGIVTAVGLQNLKFALSGALASDTAYTVTVGTSIRDESGNALAAPFVWSFTTGAIFDITPPTVVATTPASGGACAFTDSKPTVTFSEDIDRSTVTAATFNLTDGSVSVPGSISALSNRSFRFSPRNGLQYSTTYTATVTSGILDLAGKSLEANYPWTFATAAPGSGNWRAIADAGAVRRNRHSAIWTGSEMIVWGGQTFGDWETLIRSGFRYDPVSDRFVETSSAGAPSPRFDPIAVWTGTEMIVWGGFGFYSADGQNVGIRYLTDGARYDPVTDTWRPVSTIGSPSDRNWGTGVWTGTEMIVLSVDQAAKYDPAVDAWSPIAAPNGWYGGTPIIWTGEEVITVWATASTGSSRAGAAYDPRTDTWRAVSGVNAPTLATNWDGYTTVWTGTEIVLWGGRDNGGAHVASGAAYDPKTDTWRPLSACGASPRADHSAVWTGSAMLVWGGTSPNTGQAYDPATDTWRQLAVVNAPSIYAHHSAIWTGTEMIIWGADYAQAASGGVYTP